MRPSRTRASADKEIAGGSPHRPAARHSGVAQRPGRPQGVGTAAGSLVRGDHVATAEAVVTRRLREAGVVFVGKTNLHEFAFGTTTEDSGFGPARNPLDPTRSPGGSSGGSAAAVATGMSLGTVGTDTGGSTAFQRRRAASSGLKREWGYISASGVVPLSRQLDHVGPLAASVADAWIHDNAMLPAGRSDRRHAGGGVAEGPAARRAVGDFSDRLDADVERSVLATIEPLRQRRATVTEVTLPHATDMAAIYLHLVFGDAAEYHARTLLGAAEDYTTHGPPAPRNVALRAGRRLHPRVARQGDHRARDRPRPRRRRRPGRYRHSPYRRRRLVRRPCR